MSEFDLSFVTWKSMLRQLFFYSLLLSAVYSFSQRGKDGVGTVTVANSVVNVYRPLTANALIGNTSVNISSSAGFTVGDLVFIIQMQGVSVNAGRDTLFPDVNSAIPTNSTFGAITNYNNCGNYEFAQVRSIPNNTSLELDCGLGKNYNYLNKVQVIKVPRYTTLSVSGAGNIVCPQWNGTTGGVIVVEVQNNATLSAVPSFNASNLGFRGGAIPTALLSYVSGGNKYGHISQSEGAYKGESVNGDTTRYQAYSSQHCRGAMANGGGGGDTHNAGGGGGANGGDISLYTGLGNPAAGYNAAWNLEFAGFAGSTSSGGGRGGYSYSSSNQNPLTIAPGNIAWASDRRRNVGGFGGRPLTYTTGKLFIGGGGGAGHGNDLMMGRGGNGGGLIYMLVYGDLSGAGTIISNGENGGAAGTNCASNDGGGGGGGGGTIILDVIGGKTLTAVTPLSARGGAGGNVNYNCIAANSTAYGPGAGGGGGYIGSTNAVPANNITGGANGIHSGNNNLIGTSFPPNGATAGGSGSTAVIPASPTISVTHATICVNNTATVSASMGTSAISWFTVSAGGTSVGSGTLYTTPSYSATGVYSLYAQPCPGSYRELVMVTVTNGPTLSVNSPSICYGASAVLTASGASTYTWNTGANTVSISVNPTATTVYTVSGSASGCSSSVTGTVSVGPIGTISVNSPTICSGNSTVLTAGAASSYTWSTGSNNQTVSVSPTLTSTYTVTATTAGSCILSNTGTVTVNTTPTVSSSGTTICSGNTVTLTASGATSYTWNPGPQTGSAIAVSPTATVIYTITASGNSCTATRTVQVNVNATPNVSVNTSSICSGNFGTLTASGAVTYSWNTGASTASIAANPSVTTVYTVTGTSGSCSAAVTGTINVTSTPTLSVNTASICPGNNAVLTASGAASYSWNTGALTASISVSPSVNTVYTVTGNNGVCSDTKTTAVNVGVSPSVSLNSNLFNICGGQTATIIASGNGTYSWSTGSTSSVITTTVSGVHSVSVTNACGTAVQSATVNGGAAPAFTINASSTVICNSQSVTLNTAGSTGTFVWSNGAGNTPSISTNVPGIYTATLTNPCGTAVYSISLIDGGNSLNLAASANTICAGGSVTITATGSGTLAWSTGAGNVPAITVTNSGIYTASLTGICPGVLISTVLVSNGPLPSLNITPSATSFCQGQTATLTANGSAGTYSWNTGATGPVLTTSVSGIYTAAVSNSCGIGTETVSVNFQSLPSVSLNAGKTVICPGETLALTAIGAGGGTLYSWSNSANTGSVENVNASGIYTVTYSNACGNSSATIAISSSTLSPDFIFSPNGGTAPIDITFTNTSVNNLNDQWHFGNGITSSAANPVKTYTAPGTYTVLLIIENADGCVASVTKTLSISDQGFQIPDLFTPNGDDKNDLFEIIGIGRFPNNELIIYNRWGNLIYERTGYNNTWDGTSLKGGKLPAGTYYYILKLNNEEGSVYKGYVQIAY